MVKIKGIKLDDETVIYVEMDEADLPKSVTSATADDLPEGAEPVRAKGRAKNAIEILKGMLVGTANALHEGIKKTKPDEWNLEMNIGFKGKVNPIPVILSGESNVAMKVTLKWKNLNSNK